MQAFIFSSRGDIEAACVVAVHIHRLGQSAVVMIDEEDEEAGRRAVDRHPGVTVKTTMFPRTPRLVGARCTAGIFASIDRVAEDAVVAKLDADMVLSWRAIEWLAGASETGRTIRLGNGCSGAWAMPRKAVEKARAAMERQRCSGCPEAVLSSMAMREACGLEISEQAFTVWRLPREVPTSAFAVTMPSGMTSSDRLASVRAACVY